MQANRRQPHRASDGAPVHYERHRPEQTTLYRLLQRHAQIFFGQTEEATSASLPPFVKDEFDAFHGVSARGAGPHLGHGVAAAAILKAGVAVSPTSGLSSQLVVSCRRGERHV